MGISMLDRQSTIVVVYGKKPSQRLMSHRNMMLSWKIDVTRLFVYCIIFFIRYDVVVDVYLRQRLSYINVTDCLLKIFCDLRAGRYCRFPTSDIEWQYITVQLMSQHVMYYEEVHVCPQNKFRSALKIIVGLTSCRLGKCNSKSCISFGLLQRYFTLSG